VVVLAVGGRWRGGTLGIGWKQKKLISTIGKIIKLPYDPPLLHLNTSYH